MLIKEVDFLESVTVPDAPEDDSEEARERDAVGRIDTVLVHPDKPNEWCALELQAVSSAGCESHLAQCVSGSALVFPDKQRKKTDLTSKVLKGRFLRKAAVRTQTASRSVYQFGIKLGEGRLAGAS